MEISAVGTAGDAINLVQLRQLMQRLRIVYATRM